MTDSLPSIAIIGGTGALGGGLAARWAQAGHAVIIGSRSSDKAARAAAAIEAGAGAPPVRASVRGMGNAEAAATGDIVVVTVPYANHTAILDQIGAAVRGKIVVDATVPLTPPKVGTARLPEHGSAAQAAQAILGEGAVVVSALHNVAAHKLAKAAPIDCDVLVCSDDEAARAAVVALVGALGLRGLHAGPLANSAAAEALTSVLITINRRYKVDGAGIRITGDLTGDLAGGLAGGG